MAAASDDELSLWGGAITCSLEPGLVDVSQIRPLQNAQEMYITPEDCPDTVLFELLESEQPLPDDAAAEGAQILDRGVLQYFVDQAAGNEVLASGLPDGFPASTPFASGCRIVNGVAVVNSIAIAQGNVEPSSESAAPTSARAAVTSAELLDASAAAAVGFPDDPPIVRAVACGMQLVGDAEAESAGGSSSTGEESGDVPLMDVAVAVGALRVAAIGTDVMVCVNVPTASSKRRVARAAQAAEASEGRSSGEETKDAAKHEEAGDASTRSAELEEAMRRAKEMVLCCLGSLRLVDVGLFDVS